jgi:hypothetical protein
MGVLWANNFFTYNSDNGQTYTVGLSALVAAVSNFQLATSLLINYPRGWKMRRVYGRTADGLFHASVPVSSISDGLWTGSTTSFLLHGTTYYAQGRIGEKRRVRV